MNTYKTTRQMLSELEQRLEILSCARPFADKTLDKIRDYYKARLVYDGNSLEGFTYTLNETEMLLKYGITVDGKPAFQAIAVSGLGEAYDKMFEIVQNKFLSFKDICNLHNFLQGSLGNNSKAGKIRSFEVGSRNMNGSIHAYPSPEKLPSLIKKLEQWSEKREKIHPIEFAAIFHKNFENIHPFGDGNGRVGRLVLNLHLVQTGYLPIEIGLKNRAHYINALKSNENESIIRFVADMENNSMNNFFSFFDQKHKPENGNDYAPTFKL